MQINKVEEIATRFNEMCKWLENVGVKFSKTRIQQYLNAINLISGAFKNNLPVKIDDLLINTLFELNELIRIFNCFSNNPTPIEINKLFQITSGSIDYKNENGKNNGARNLSFELLIYSYLKQNNIPIALSCQDEDLRMNFMGFDVFIECKRPFFEHSIGSNIKGAMQQLRKRYLTAPEPNVARGIACLSLSRALNPDQKYFSAPDVQGVFSEIVKIKNSFIKNYQSKWRSEIDKRTIGLLLHFSFMAFLRSNKMPTTVDQFIMVYLSNNNEKETKLINKIGEAINNIVELKV